VIFGPHASGSSAAAIRMLDRHTRVRLDMSASAGIGRGLAGRGVVGFRRLLHGGSAESSDGRRAAASQAA
jgi:hypothetical protein